MSKLENWSYEATELEKHGWLSREFSAPTESLFENEVLYWAGQLGQPLPSRINAKMIDRLCPIHRSAAPPRSLSRIFSTGAFPLHNDTAHWLTPCRFVILACLLPGAANRPTLLLDTKRANLRENETELLHTVPLRITNGRHSFFASVFSKTQPFLRYDNGCMQPVCPGGKRVLDIFSQERWKSEIEEIHWSRGKVVLIDNWRMLHGRKESNQEDLDRTLIRVLIQ